MIEFKKIETQEDFIPYSGDLIGLPTSKNHLNFRWCEPGCKVLFSVTRHGSGASCHFASDKTGVVKIRQAINEFVEFVFNSFDWCEMILALIKYKKVKRWVRECGFAWTLGFGKRALYIKKREWQEKT